MGDFGLSILTIFFFILIGYSSRVFGLLDKSFGKKLYKFLFSVPLPIIVFVSLSSNEITSDLIALPIIGALVAIILVFVAFVFGKGLSLDRKRLGTLITAAGITSTLSFALPFIIEFYGQDASRFLFLYDFGGAIVVWTFVYYIGGLFGNKKEDGLKKSIMNFLKNPMLWALLLGIIGAIIGIKLPEFILNLSSKVGDMTSPLILLGIGIFLDLTFFKKAKNLLLLLTSVIIIMLISVSLAYLLSIIFGIEGIMLKVILISAIAPSGALTVPFAVEHELDTEFASSLVAATMVIALVITPFLIAI